MEMTDDDMDFSICTRLDPIGAPNDTDISSIATQPDVLPQKYHYLEEEQGSLSVSVLALANHLAQIQFRLRQTINAPVEEREGLLESLEDFASKEIFNASSIKENLADSHLAEYIDGRYFVQTELIGELKRALHKIEVDAENTVPDYREESCAGEKLEALIRELGKRTNFKIDNHDYLFITTASLRQKLNVTLDEMMNPLKEKDRLIKDYRNQLEDLERLVRYLQEYIRSQANSWPYPAAKSITKRVKSRKVYSKSGFLDKLLTLLRVFVRVYFGCGLRQGAEDNFYQNIPQNHWGNLRAKLQLAILRVGKIGRNLERDGSNYRAHMTSAVLNYLAPAIRDLMQHGMITAENETAVPLLICIPRTAINTHAWRVLLNYYVMKNGDQLGSSPVRRLSQSFNLDIDGALPDNEEEHLVLTIDRIMSLYRTYKRNSDVHFKAFVCAALNAKKLATWLDMIFRCDALIKFHYLPWSYVAKTRFQDSLVSLEALSDTAFDLPVDYAIKRFLNIKDMFT